MIVEEHESAKTEDTPEGVGAAVAVAIEWLAEVRGRVERGEGLDSFDAIWPLLVAEAKVAQVIGTVCPEALTDAETRFYGAALRFREGLPGWYTAPFWSHTP